MYTNGDKILGDLTVSLVEALLDCIAEKRALLRQQEAAEVLAKKQSVVNIHEGLCAGHERLIEEYNDDVNGVAKVCALIYAVVINSGSQQKIIVSVLLLKLDLEAAIRGGIAPTLCINFLTPLRN
uniref:Uncharacterized protein n=1 Tax=Angiostrongylus cantonensis TaxID=6313 RepID=A0A0K0DND0_ANGCA